MKLINVDDIDKEIVLRLVGRTTLQSLERLIKRTPTANAIPMEFIKEFQNNTINTLKWNRVNELVDAWEKENEKQTVE